MEEAKAVAAEQISGVRVGASRGDIGAVIAADAARKSRNERRRENQFTGNRNRVAELRETAADRSRKTERIEAANARRVAGRERRHGVGIGPQPEVAAKVLQAGADLDLIAQTVRDGAVNAACAGLEGRRNH